MIRLKIRVGTEEIEKKFTSLPIVVGLSDTLEIELALLGELKFPEKIRITQKENKNFVASCTARDPTIALNGSVFEESPLNEGDIFSLGEIQLSVLELSLEDQDINMSDHELDDLLSQIDEEEPIFEDQLIGGGGDDKIDEPSEDKDKEDIDELLASFDDELEEESGDEFEGESEDQPEEELDLDALIAEDPLADIDPEEATSSELEALLAETEQANEELLAAEKDIEETSQENIADAIDSLFLDASDSEGEEFDIDNIINEADEKEKQEKKKFEEEIEADGILVFDEDESDISKIRKDAGAIEEKPEEIIEKEQAAEDEDKTAEGEEQTVEDEDKTVEEEEENLNEKEVEEPLAEDSSKSEPVTEKEGESDEAEDEYEAESENLEEPKEEILAAHTESANGSIYDEEDENDHREAALLDDLHQKKRLLIFAGLVVGFVIIAVTVFSGINMYVDSFNKTDEIKAAQSMADLAMGLTRAKLFNEQIQDGDIRSGSFQGRQLAKVLAPNYASNSPLVDTDYLKSVDYDLKVYFSKQQERFLVVAIPLSGFFQSWSPKKALIIDSETFNIRQTSNIDAWIKLLEGVSSLEDMPRFEVTNLAEGAESVNLVMLNDGERRNGFSPPRALEDWRPGAEFNVYNAPRYYPFTDSIIRLAARLANEGGTENDLETFTNEIKRLSVLEELIFYSSEGVNLAREAYKAISVYTPSTPFILGYVSFEEGGQFIDEGRLLSEDDFPESTDVPAITMANKNKRRYEVTVEKEREAEASMESLEEDKGLVSTEVNPSEDLNVARLQALGIERKRALSRASRGLQTLLAKQEKEPLENFDKKYSDLFTRYQEIDIYYQNKIDKELEALYLEYDAESEKGHAAYLNTIEKAGMGEFLEGLLVSENKEGNLGRTSERDKKAILNLFKELKEENSLKSLRHVVKKLSLQLKNSKTHDPVQIVAWQNELRSLVLEKLSLLFLSPESLETHFIVENSDRKTLDNILHDAGISGEDEREFYLEEFDRLMEDYRSAPDSRELDGLKEINEKLAKYTVFDALLTDDQREELEKEHEQAIQSIEEKQRELGHLKSQISKIPLSGMSAMTLEEEKQELGRVGQQVLITASLQDPSPNRDGMLREAITLLEEGLVDNRALWSEILEARRLLAQTSEVQILEALESGVGFITADHSLPALVKDELANYLEVKKNLALVRDPHQFGAYYKQFRIVEKKRLGRILEGISKIQKESKKLDSSVKEYEKRLNEFAVDYERAKLQGFFVADLAYQSQMANRLLRKIRHAEHFRDEVSMLAQQLLKSSSKHRTIAGRELDSLKGYANALNVDEVRKAFQETHEIVYPNLAMANLPEKAKRLFGIIIAPLNL